MQGDPALRARLGESGRQAYEQVYGWDIMAHRLLALYQEVEAEAALPLAASGVQRLVWDGRYGQILIEVIGSQVRVNGDVVEPAAEVPAADLLKPVWR